MAHRLVTIVDTDVKLATHLKGELSRWGLTAEVVPDANDLMARKDDLPELVVLCIDPKRTGWAVCNRLRKSPFLKSVPLIITSAEATEKDFDDHKKLKTRAEEYLHKPFTIESLVDKVSALLGVPATGVADGGDVELGEIDVEPIGEELGAVEYSDELTLGGRQAPTASFEGAEDESTRIGFVSEIDGEVDLETNAAFAAIGLDDPAEQTASRPAPTSPFDDDPFEPESTAHASAAHAAPVEDIGGLADEIEPVSDAIELPADAAAEFDGLDQEISHTHHEIPSAVVQRSAPADLDSVPVPKLSAEELGIDLEEVARDAADIVAAPTAAHSVATISAPDTAALEEAHREIERLRRELDDVRAKAKDAPTSFSREREFLNLRETINKKEKEVLDLKDAIDSRDRQMLDGKDKLRDAERKLREIEERALAGEREHVAVKEQLEAITAEKDKSAEREKQVKGRLEDTQKGLARAEEEIDSWRTRHTNDTHALDEKLNAAVAKSREELGMLRQSHAEALAEQKTEHTSSTAKLRAEHEAALGSLRDEHAAALGSLRDEHAGALAALKGQHADATSRAEQQHREQLEGELRAAERRQGEAIVDLESKHEAALAEAQARAQEAQRVQAEEAARAHAQAVAAHAEEKARLESEHARRVEELGAQHQAALEQAEANAAQQQQQALADQAVLHEDALKAAREQSQRKLQALEESHEDLKAGMNARHQTQVKDLREQHQQAVTEFQAALAERDGIITQQREQHATIEAALADEQVQGQVHTRRIGELEAELEGVRAELGARTHTIAERDARIGELEQESARYQDQILRAYQRIKSDENIVQRAKKALAIALTLLEESDNKPSEEASS